MPLQLLFPSTGAAAELPRSGKLKGHGPARSPDVSSLAHQRPCGRLHVNRPTELGILRAVPKLHKIRSLLSQFGCFNDLDAPPESSRKAMSRPGSSPRYFADIILKSVSAGSIPASKKSCTQSAQTLDGMRSGRFACSF
jgi:hypothetical protein